MRHMRGLIRLRMKASRDSKRAAHRLFYVLALTTLLCWPMHALPQEGNDDLSATRLFFLEAGTRQLFTHAQLPDTFGTKEVQSTIASGLGRFDEVAPFDLVTKTRNAIAFQQPRSHSHDVLVLEEVVSAAGSGIWSILSGDVLLRLSFEQSVDIRYEIVSETDGVVRIDRIRGITMRTLDMWPPIPEEWLALAEYRMVLNANGRVFLGVGPDPHGRRFRHYVYTSPEDIAMRGLSAVLKESNEDIRTQLRPYVQGFPDFR